MQVADWPSGVIVSVTVSVGSETLLVAKERGEPYPIRVRRNSRLVIQLKRHGAVSLATKKLQGKSLHEKTLTST